MKCDCHQRESDAESNSTARSRVPLNYAPERRRPLPQARNIAGRPACEPPGFDYSELIGEEYEQKRKTLFKYFMDDVVKTTAYMDVITELDLLDMYMDSVGKDE